MLTAVPEKQNGLTSVMEVSPFCILESQSRLRRRRTLPTASNPTSINEIVAGSGTVVFVRLTMPVHDTVLEPLVVVCM